tara:strand:+ start:41 stop:2332 length:2292 start_codon:yes stop_codon:yes gene_type:complete
MTSRDLSIDGQQFGLDFNPRFRKDFKTFDIDSLFKNETTRPIAAGFLREVGGLTSKVQSDFESMVNSENIEKLGDEDREIYGKYLKMISKKILESKLSDLLDSFDDAEVRKKVFKEFPKGGILQNRSLEKYLIENDTLVQDIDAKTLRDVSATKEQQLSLTKDGTRLTRLLLKPNTQNITKPSALIDMSKINEPKYLSVRGEKNITITFDSLQYMKELFEAYDYDEPFEFQEDDEKIKGVLGRFPSDDESLEGLAFPSNRIILTSTPEDKMMKNSYIDGEGLDEKTTITAGIKRNPRDNTSVEGVDIPAYNYITISPSFDESVASKKEREFTITYVHRNENSIVKVSDNSESEDLKKGDSEELLMFAQAYKPEDEVLPTFDLYINDGSASFTSPVVQDLTFDEFKETVPDKDWVKKYKYTGKNNPIDRIIASSLTPRIKRMSKAGIVYDVYLPLGLVEIVVKSDVDDVIKDEKKGEERKNLQGRMIDATTEDDINKKLEEMVDEYAKYADVIVAFDETKRNMEGPDEFVERVLGEGGKDVPLQAKEVTENPAFFEPPVFDTASGEFKPSPTSGTGTIYVKTKRSLTEKYVDLEKMASGSSKGLLTSRDFYLVMLKLARDKVDAKPLKNSIYGATDSDAIKLLIGLIPEEEKYILVDKPGGSEGEKVKVRDTRESPFAKPPIDERPDDYEEVSAYFDKGTGKIPILKLKSARAKYKKQLLLTGPAGLPGVGGRTEITGNVNTAKRVLRGIKSYNKKINRAVGDS